MDINKLTLGEMATVEKFSGQSIGALGDEDAPKSALFAALCYVIKKRENPEFTMDDANNLTMDEVTELLGLNDEDEEDPKA